MVARPNNIIEINYFKSVSKRLIICNAIISAMPILNHVFIQVGRGPPRDVDGGPGLAQLQGDAAPDPPGGSCDQANLPLQRR